MSDMFDLVTFFYKSAKLIIKDIITHSEKKPAIIQEIKTYISYNNVQTEFHVKFNNIGNEIFLVVL